MLHYQMNVQSIDDISWIIEAAQETMNATEKDFEAIRTKRWYKRLWETVTFSKDNQIKMAKGVSSLSKLQEIMIRLLVVLSQNNTEISNAVKQNSDLINRLAITDTLLSRQIDKIKFGGTSQIDFSDLSREKRTLVASLLIMADPVAQRNEYSKQYISSVLRAANIPSFDNTVKIDAVDCLDKEEQELLYRMIMIDRHLMDIDFNEPSEVIDWLSVSPRRKDEIICSIRDTASAVSPEFFAAYYEKISDNLDAVSNDDIIFEDNTHSDTEEHNGNKESSKTDTVDSSPDEIEDKTESFCVNYDELDNRAEKNIVSYIKTRLLIMRQEGDTCFYKAAEEFSEGERKAILAQMTYPGQENTTDIIGIYDVNPFHALNNNYSGILFLTQGFYFKENDRASLQYMEYSDIDRVEEKYFTLLIIGKHETIKLKSASYAQTYLAEAFRALASLRKDPEPPVIILGTEPQNVQNNENESARMDTGNNVKSSSKPAVWLYPLAMDRDNANIETSGVIKEIYRCNSSDDLVLQIQGKVIEGNMRVGSYCKLYNQEGIYKIMKIGQNDDLTQCFVDQKTKFTLKKCM